MNIESHNHRTNVLQAILALWAENEEMSLNELVNKFGLIHGQTDEHIIEHAKSLLSPKKPYVLVQLDKPLPNILDGKDRNLFTLDELANFFQTLPPMPRQTQMYLTFSELNDVELAGNKDFIASLPSINTPPTPPAEPQTGDATSVNPQTGYENTPTGEGLM